ncbi:MAG: NAD(P)/FAD-dependent oxidoreductase [Candidatus Berkelbacteria bacterium]|nr:NAD(P)/FAD-dependent oxidoreductase [Candidatus Berkelbacteria bacterium]
MTDVVIIGSGMAGLSAALYTARYELSTVVIGAEFGGATSTAWTIENYPGYKAIDGYDLMMKVKEQVEALGAKVVADKIEKITKSNGAFKLTGESGEEYLARSVIFTHGAARRKLNLPKEDDFSLGKGVHYCTTCDGPLYKGKTIAIVGSGDASVKGALLAVQYAEKIYMIVRGDGLHPEPINAERLKPFLGTKVEVLPNSQVKEILGDSRLTGVKLANDEELKLDGLFIEIGAIPEMELVESLEVKLDQHGYVTVNNMMETNIEGVFAAGDATNFFGHFKQDITAAAMGAVAATSAFNFLQKT